MRCPALNGMASVVSTFRLCQSTDSQVPQNTNPDSAALAAQSKFAGDIIKSSKFPAAQAPQPDETAKIETDYWPCPPSLAALGRLLPLAPPGRFSLLRSM